MPETFYSLGAMTKKVLRSLSQLGQKLESCLCVKNELISQLWFPSLFTLLQMNRRCIWYISFKHSVLERPLFRKTVGECPG